MPTTRELSTAAERALLQEAHLCKRLIETGLTVLRGADAANTGAYYQAFFELSTALERLGKLILALDFFQESGTFPSDRYFRDSTKTGKGHHELYSLMTRVEAINLKRGYGVENVLLESSSELSLLNFLSAFANSERYYNLKSLNKQGSAIDDPVATWERLMIPLIPEKRKKLNKEEVETMHFAIYLEEQNLPVLIHQRTENNDSIRSLATGAQHAYTMRRANEEGVLLCIHIFRYLSQMINKTTTQLHRQRIQVPHFNEFFYLWLNKDSYLRGRRNFTR